jgi:cytochrome P450
LPPGPKGRFLIGNMLELGRDWMGFLGRCAREYGDVVFIRFFNVPICLLTHPKDIEHVLVTNQSNFVKSRDYRVLAKVLGDGLLTTEGEVWQRQRKLVQPAFRHENSVGYGKLMMECAERMMEGWQDGQPFEVHREMIRLTLDIVARALFGAIVSNQSHAVSSAIQVMMEEFTRHANISFLVPEGFPLPISFRLRRAARSLDAVVYSIIRNRRQRPNASQDLLSTLLHTVHEDGGPMTDFELRAEMVTLLTAGHETTAVALSWTWYLLAQHPEVEAKLQQELSDVLMGHSPSNNDLPRLPYTEMVIKESMRLYPPAWGVGRRALKEFEIGGYWLPAGTNVFLMQWLTHRDPRFYSERDAFRPERWEEDPIRNGKIPRFA